MLCGSNHRLGKFRGCRTKKLVRSLFYVQKNYSQTSKSLAVGVKYKYAKTYITTQELYFE